MDATLNLTSDDADGFAPMVSNALAEKGLEARIFDRQARDPVSPMHAFDEWYKRKHDQVQQDVAAKGKPVRRSVPITFTEPEQSLSIETEAGPRPVAAIRLHVEIVRTKRLVPASRATRYSDERADLAESVEFNLNKGLGTVSLHKLSEGTNPCPLPAGRAVVGSD